MKRIIILFALLLATTTYAQMNMAEVTGMLGNHRTRIVSLEAEELVGSTVGENVFTTTGATDTVVISGAAVTDTYIVCGQYTAGVDQQDVLQWEALATGLVVHRLASGESALKYSWLRIPTP